VFEGLIGSPAIRTIGWSLIGFVWQGALVGSLTALALRLIGGRDPRVRYAVACTGLVLMAALPVLTVLRTYAPNPAGAGALPLRAGIAEGAVAGLPESGAGIASSSVSQAIPEGPATEGGVPSAWTIASRDWLSWLVVVWFGGVVVLSLRLLGGWLVVCRMARRGVPVPASLASRIATLRRRLRVSGPVRALESPLVEVPTVVGWLRPVVLVPASAIAGLSPEQLEAVIAHELAHVRRHDYAVNLLQRVEETLFFYHPAVWWLSNRIRVEREQCADDMAVAACGDAALYAEALRDLETVRHRTALAMSAAGGSLASRIGRLLGQPPARQRWTPGWIAVVMAAAVGATLWGTEATVTATTPEPAVVLAAAPAPAAPEIQSEQALEIRAQEEAARARELEARALESAAVHAAVEEELVRQTEPRVAELAAQRANPNRVIAVAPGDPDTTWIGIQLSDGEEQGAVVQSVEPESPAANAGIEAGDLITELDGTRVAGYRQLTRMIQETPVGRTVRVTLVRNGTAEVREVTLAARPGGPIRVLLNPGLERLNDQFEGLQATFTEPTDLRFYQNRWVARPSLRLGLRVEDMTPELRSFFGAASNVGILVSSVQEGTPAEAAGVRVGDVIVALDGSPVDSRADLNWSGELDDPTITLGIIRDRTGRDLDLTLEIPPRNWQIVP
jgi:S1-C subfamily serine protease